MARNICERAIEAVRLADCRLASWFCHSRNHCSRTVRTVYFSHNNQPEQYFSVLPNSPITLTQIQLLHPNERIWDSYYVSV